MRCTQVIIIGLAMLVASCGDTSEKAAIDLDPEEVIEKLDSKKQEEAPEPEVQIEEPELTEEEKGEFQEAEKKSQEKRAEKIAASPLVPFVDDPAAFPAYFKAEIEKFAGDCNVDGMYAYLEKCGDDEIFKNLFSNPDVQPEIAKCYDRAAEIDKDCN